MDFFAPLGVWAGELHSPRAAGVNLHLLAVSLRVRVARRTEMRIQMEWGARGCEVVSPIRAGVGRPPPRRWRNEYVGGGAVSSFGRACPASRVVADGRDIDQQ
jgi:hypothetical protein